MKLILISLLTINFASASSSLAYKITLDAISSVASSTCVDLKVNTDANTGEMPDKYKVIVTVSGCLDDSVSAEAYIFSYKVNQDYQSKDYHKFEIVKRETSFKCSRGKLQGKWTNKLCP